MRKLIHGGMVYDGMGGPPRQADLLISGGCIEAVEPGLVARDIQAERIDACGRVVAPGFIDMHRHADIAPFRDAAFGQLELAQGITATAVGNCGLGPVPMNAAYAKQWNAFLEPVVGKMANERAFESFESYAAALKAAPLPIHIGFLAGTGAVRVAVKGFDPAPYTPGEREAAREWVRRAMEAGALGVSLGLMYLPDGYGTPEEQAYVIQPVARENGLMTIHIRGEGDSLLPSVEEALEIAKRAEIRLHISHFKSTGIANWNGQIYRAIERIQSARNRGMQVTADFYPYAGGSTTLVSLIPPKIWGQGGEEALAFLKTSQGKRALREEIAKAHADWDNMALSIGWDRILIASVQKPEHAGFSGRDIASLAIEQGVDAPSDFVCDLLAEENGQVGIVVLSMDERDVDAVARLPFTAVISDALYGGGSSPHPRLYGAFAKAIRDFVLERGVLPMETAIHKMTGMPAGLLGLGKRGLLLPGYPADVTIFEPERFRDHALYTDSRQLSTGMERVMLSGETVFENERMLSPRGGFLSRQSESKNK